MAPRCIGFGPCDRPAGPSHPRFCDRCQEQRVAHLTDVIARLTETGVALVGYMALYFDEGRTDFLRGYKHGGPSDRRTRAYRAWQAGYELEELTDMQAKGWP